MALGKGLGSLIPTRDSITATSNKVSNSNLQIEEVNPSLIQVNPHQPRQKFNPSDLEDLINSIKIHGIIQPLVVTRRNNGGFELIAGERRLRSARVLNLPVVPVIIRDSNEQQKLELAIIENIQRKNLNAYEEAVAYARLLNEFNLTQEDVARRVGKSRSTIANLMRILDLPQEVREANSEERITEGHARTIASLETESAQLQMLKKILEHGLSVRESESIVREQKPSNKSKLFNPIVSEYEEKLRDFFGTKVYIKKQGQKGEIKIPFSTNEDFKTIIDKLFKR